MARRRVLGRVSPWVLALGLLVPCAPAARAEEVYVSPNWNITVSDYGYADFLIYSGGSFPAGHLHEMISGEWAAAIGYDGIPLPAPQESMWLEPNFVYPNWTSNSNFVVTEPASFPDDLDADGLPEGYSVIENDDVRVRIEYDFEDTVTGTPIGVGGGQAVLSDRYVFLQRYIVTNLRPTTLTGMRLYQFLHGHPANTETNTVMAVYDPTLHAGAAAEYRYDTTQHALNSGAADGSETGWLFEDHIAFSSTSAPDSRGLGHYRGHFERPEDGLHVDVENDTLGQETSFGPDEVAGAERWSVAALAPGGSFTFTVQLAVRSVDLTPSVPCTACVIIQPTAGDPTILLEKGACAAPGVGGPYDVITGDVHNLLGELGSGFIQILSASCVADELAADRVAVTASLPPLALRFVLVRHGGGAQFDYGTSSAGDLRFDVFGSCP